MYTFIITYTDGKELRLKADHFHHGFAGERNYFFYRSKERTGGSYDCMISDALVVSVIPQDMLLSSFEDGTLLPEVMLSSDSRTDFAKATLFSEEDKVPFSQNERVAIRAALQDVEEKIRKTFQTKDEQQEDIKQKIDYLSTKVETLDRFDWKRLLVTTLVGISVDLGFGTLIPGALLDLFKEALSHLLKKLIA
jgi:hypothetical protein